MGFFAYYQISLDYEDDTTEESEPRGSGELISESFHSPWGLIFSIARETGWTSNYILWHVTWANLQLMIADAPRLKKKTNKKMVEDDELFQILNQLK